MATVRSFDTIPDERKVVVNCKDATDNNAQKYIVVLYNP
jgi:hypothetical protein